MDLPNLLNKLKSNTEEPKKFIAIEIGIDVVKTAIWQSTGVHTEVISTGSTQNCPSENGDELITAIDLSLSDAERNPSEEVNQVIFGLPESWTCDEGIIEPKKIILKTICSKLGLKAIGFVVTTEAMIHHLRDVEGGPPSAILIQVAAAEIGVSLVYLGKLEATEVVERSTNIATDVEEGLARIPHTGHLPSRIIVMSNQDDPEPIKQDLISYDWQKKLEFLHIPKVESLPKEWSIKSVAVTGGAEVIESLGFSNLQVSEPKPEPKPEPEPTPEADFGFTPVNFEQGTIPEEIAHQIDDNLEPVSKQKENLLLGFGHRIKSVLPVKPNIKKVSLILIISLILVGLLVGVELAAFKLPEAKIDVIINAVPYQQQLTFTIDPLSTEVNTQGIILPGKRINLDKTGSKTIATTGTKMVGDRAKGQVSIYNRTTAAKTLPAGTVLKSNKLQFTLDTSVTIASASTKENADYSLTTEPTKVDAKVTASDIGEQYNLSKDSELTVANFASDNFVAVVTNALAGGSAKKVPAVSKDDLVTVEEELKQEIAGQIDQGASTNPELSMRQIRVGEPTVTTQKYSHKVGDEASELTLDLTLSQATYQYDVAELSLIAAQVATGSLPANVMLTPNSTVIDILSTTMKDADKAEVSAKVTLQYIPRIDTSLYVKELVFLPLGQVESKLSALQNFQSYTIVESKLLLLGRLPLDSNRISLRVKTATKN